MSIEDFIAVASRVINPQPEISEECKVFLGILEGKSVVHMIGSEVINKNHSKQGPEQAIKALDRVDREMSKDTMEGYINRVTACKAVIEEAQKNLKK